MESKKTNQELTIEEIINKKFKPLYIFQSAILGIFITIAWPIYDKVYDLRGKMSDLENVCKGMLTEEEANAAYLRKPTYHQLQKDEHLTDLEAIRNPKDADIIYQRHNAIEADRLEVSYRGGNN